MTFLAPIAFAVIGCALVAVAALVLMLGRQSARARRLGFRASAVPALSGMAAIAAMLLIAVASAQPAVLRSAPERSRDDVEAWIAIDTSNSMLAARAPGSVDRLRQARQAALAIRRQLGGLKVGIAVMTSRVLPLLPPTADEDIFAAVDRGSVQPGTPRPLISEINAAKVSTSFSNLELVPELNFYGNAKRKLLVVISDMETAAFDADKVSAAFASHHVGLILMQVGSAADRVWANSRADPSYHPQRSEAPKIARLAEASAGGRLFTIGETGAVAKRVHSLVGHGPSSVGQQTERRYVLLSPYLLLAALPMLVYLLAASCGGGGRGQRVANFLRSNRRRPERESSSLMIK